MKNSKQPVESFISGFITNISISVNLLMWNGGESLKENYKLDWLEQIGFWENWFVLPMCCGM